MDEITFPMPAAGWGTATHFVVPNPARRWWAFWRPRTLVLELPPDVHTVEQVWLDGQPVQPLSTCESTCEPSVKRTPINDSKRRD